MPESCANFSFKFGICHKRGGPGHRDQCAQFCAVTLRGKLLGKERHYGRDRALQNCSPKRVDQILTVLQDEHDNFTGLYALALKSLSVSICAAHKLVIG